jgi:hypothetical protein
MFCLLFIENKTLTVHLLFLQSNLTARVTFKNTSALKKQKSICEVDVVGVTNEQPHSR